ncbi:MAG: hypothetical protein A3K19_32740 [Lentisphaerae bacterium RIFOXYB12_FULL_65_16]|nr:MAG: hypothetical protein A3K18_20525 [Lentisphaerae bacterium RIFOXYA12_64_32]OGV84511.1 MAG: hypothetical protein A3K19_32740 [Lentisphaerae bacterium RIFOXYB12_FULL_65_16]
MAGNPKLKVLSRNLRGKDGKALAFDLTEPRYTVGRTEESNICLPDASVSTHHAELLYTAEEDYAVQDVGSTNGTRVNGVGIGTDARQLTHGDIVQFGGVEVFYE